MKREFKCMLEILLFCFAGIGIGIFAGILPGIHPNQVYVALIGFLPLLSGFSDSSILSLILACAISNVMFNYIPSLFFSLPDSSTVMNVLPGHRMVLEGKGLDALFISLVGAFITLIVCIITLPGLLYVIPIVHGLLYPYLHFLLFGLAAWMIIMEKTWRKKIISLFLFLVSGIWGILCLNSVVISSEWALFPTLTGMFGIAGLLMSMEEGMKLPKQIHEKEIDIGNIVKIILSGVIAGLLIGVLPGAGESQAGVLVSQFTALSQREFLGALSGINMSNLFFSIVSLYSFGKIRSGAAVAIDEVILDFNIQQLVFSTGVILFTAGLSVLLTWWSGKRMLTLLERINYKRISQIILIFTVLMVLWFTGIVGVLIMIVSTCLGLLPIFWNVKRTSNMGFLMVSTTLYFAGLTWITNGVLF